MWSTVWPESTVAAGVHRYTVLLRFKQVQYTIESAIDFDFVLQGSTYGPAAA